MSENNQGALYDRLRPTSFEQVVGQKDVIVSLRSALARGVQTFILHGPSGCGKTTLARLASTVVLKCKKPIEINASSVNGIEDMRELVKYANNRPITGNISVVIIDECHGLSKQAWQSLLKPLEEPPEWLRWFLCTTEADKIPTTVKTRATTYAIKSVRADALLQFLEQVVSDIGSVVNQEILKLCADNADGSPRQALTNLELCLEAPSVKVAAGLLQKSAQDKLPIELVRALIEGTTPDVALGIVGKLQEVSPESVRHIMRAYVTKVILSEFEKSKKTTARAMRALAILEEFSTPFNQNDQLAPLVLAVCRLVIK